MSKPLMILLNNTKHICTIYAKHLFRDRAADTTQNNPQPFSKESVSEDCSLCQTRFRVFSRIAGR